MSDSAAIPNKEEVTWKAVAGQRQAIIRDLRDKLTRAGKLPIRGKISIRLDINITMEEMRDWHPERIVAFWRGVVQIVRARQYEHSQEEEI
jgi:hypothetical protein